jgi:trehalose 6-phosphate phosphatase
MATPLTSLAPLLDALNERPFALLCDVDGTLSPLAPAPGLARVTPRNRELLAALSRSILVAVVSGRDLVDLRQMVGLPEIVYIGLHGLAWRIAGSDELAPEAQPYRAWTLEAADELAHLKRITGLVLEVKSVGLALHYRNATDRSARTQILRALASSPAAGRFEVHEGIRLVELRPPIGITKGVAVRRLADRFRLRGLLFLGDDITDIDAFQEVRALRAKASIAGYGLAVAHDEAPEVAAAAADFTLPGVEGVEWLLGEIAGRVRREA